MNKKTNSTVINFRIDNKTKSRLDKKALELNTTRTELIKDGIERIIDDDQTLNNRVKIMVNNQELFNQLFRKIDNGSLQEVKSVAIEILKGEQKAWQL